MLSLYNSTTFFLFYELRFCETHKSTALITQAQFKTITPKRRNRKSFFYLTIYLQKLNHNYTNGLLCIVFRSLILTPSQDNLTTYVPCQRHHRAVLFVTDIFQDGGTTGGLNSVSVLSTVDVVETKTTSGLDKCVKDDAKGEIVSQINQNKR